MKKLVVFSNLVALSAVLGAQNNPIEGNGQSSKNLVAIENLSVSDGYGTRNHRDLIYATKHAGCEAMQGILSRNNINIDAQDEEGNTALTIAFKQNDQDKMLLLLKNGADKELASKNLSNKKKKTFKNICDQIQPKEKSVAAGGIDRRSASITSIGVEFFYAVVNRDYERAKRLFERAPANLRREYVNIQNGDGSTALICAAEDGRADMVELLLENGARINMQDKQGISALRAASLDGHNDVVRILLDNGADVNIQDNHGNTALILASQGGHVETVEELLKHKKIKVNIKNENDSTALILAAGWNHGKVVELLLKHPDVKVNLQTTEGATALMYASQNGHTEIVKMLLKKGANVDLQNNNGDTALMLASQNGHSDIVKLLSKKDADVNRVGIAQSQTATANSYSDLSKPQNVRSRRVDITPLMFASQNGHIETVKELLSHDKIEVNAQNSEGTTALMIASLNGHSDIVKLLLENGANVDIQDNDGFTALIFASQNGHTEAVKELLNHGNIDVDIRKIDGGTALMIASQYGHSDVVKLLLENGANVDLQGNYGTTALIFAAQEGHSDIVEMLREKGANANLQSNNGATALLYAVRYGHIGAVQELLKYENIDVNKLYGLLRTPILFHAIQTGNAKIVKVLLNRSDIKIQDFTNPLGFNYLMFAIQRGNEEIVKLLLDKGEDVKKTAWGGFTPLMLAVDTGGAKIVKLLLDKLDVEDVNVKNEYGETALSMAENQKYGRRIAKLIRAKMGLQPVEPFRENAERPKKNEINKKFWSAVSHGDINEMDSLLDEDEKALVDVNTRDENGNTALIIASDKGKLEAVSWLLENKADLSLKDKNGDNALIRAAKNGHLGVVDKLIKKAADINSLGQHNTTPLMAAAENDHIRVVKLLLRKKAKVSVKNDYDKTALDLVNAKIEELGKSLSSNYKDIKDILEKRSEQSKPNDNMSVVPEIPSDTWEVITSKNYEKDLKDWEKNDPKIYNKIKMLVEYIKLDPFEGLGRLKRLEGDLEGLYSRRITDKDRLVYDVDGEKVILKACKGHYEREKRK